MSGGGSIAAMNSTLKNNKMLLKGRRGFFRRELSYHDIRKFYKDSTNPLAKEEINKELLASIRNKLIAQRKKENIRRAILGISLLLLILSSLFFLINSLNHNDSLSTTTNKLDPKIKTQENRSEYAKENLTSEMIVIGLEYLNENQYFRAMGNFEKALIYHPDSLDIELLHAETLCLLCFERNQYCDKAKTTLNKYIQKYPENREFSKLSTKFLE